MSKISSIIGHRHDDADLYVGDMFEDNESSYLLPVPCFGWKDIKRHVAVCDITKVLMHIDRSRHVESDMNLPQIEQKYEGYWLGIVPELLQLLSNEVEKTVYCLHCKTPENNIKEHMEIDRYVFNPGKNTYDVTDITYDNNVRKRVSSAISVGKGKAINILLP